MFFLLLVSSDRLAADDTLSPRGVMRSRQPQKEGGRLDGDVHLLSVSLPVVMGSGERVDFNHTVGLCV